jgi:lactoylglutathione lyase
MRLAVTIVACFLVGTSVRPAHAEEKQVSAAAFDHLAIYVSDLDRSSSFYGDVFGFKPTPAPVPFARWLMMKNGVMLHLVSGRPSAVEDSKWDHVALACDDMAQMIAKLDARGTAWSDIQGNHKPQIRADGVQQIFIRDPDGYWIEINDALKTR